MTVECGDGIGPLETAAVLAALARFWEELSILEAIPPAPLTQGRSGGSGRPRPVHPPPAHPGVPRAMRESPSRSESGGV